jgi:hypothetical protein
LSKDVGGPEGPPYGLILKDFRAHSSANVFGAEHRQFPGVGSLVVANEIRIAVGASEFEVPVVGRQPRIEHLRDGDSTVTKNHCARRLLAAMACVALDANNEELFFMHPTVLR